MKVLFISGQEIIAADLAYQLQEEGCDVRLYIDDKSRKDCFDGIVPKSPAWRNELNWVGKDGLIIFDDVGYGKIQDELRAANYMAVGSSAGGEKLEIDRHFGFQIFSQCNMAALPTFSFTALKDAIKFVSKNRKAWVIKQTNHSCTVNYVGVMADGSDVINVLKKYKTCQSPEYHSVCLQAKVDGIEIGVARYFNGTDWVGPIELNIEHKHLFNNAVGPLTGEMGTLMWYDDNENNKLFKATLSKLKSYLQKVNFKGDIDINCIVTEKAAFPLEATARFGCPATQLQCHLHRSSWADLTADRYARD